MEKVVVVTGANSGIGLALCERLLTEDSRLRLCLACRNMQRAEAARAALLTSHPDALVDLLHLDVGSVQSVLTAAQEIKARYPRVDFLYLNAGIMPNPHVDIGAFFKGLFSRNVINMFSTAEGLLTQQDRLNADGMQEVFATNVFGHFVLIRELEPLLCQTDHTSRVVWTSSSNARRSAFSMEDIQHRNGVEPYSSSKYASVQSCKELRLRRASIRSCPVSAEAFRRAICPHRLLELDASWVSGGLTGADVVSGLSSNLECRSGLQRLSLSGLQLQWDSVKEDGGSHVGFSSLQGLRALNLSNTDISDAVLEDICTLPHLETLDISCTAISNLTALLGCKNTLRSLTAHRLRQLEMSPARLLYVFSNLNALRHLDFSDDHFAGDDSDGKDGDETVRQLLEGSPQVLPSLVSLDVSGRKRVSEAAVRAFVESREGLLFMGLLATGVSSCDALSSQSNLKVTGEANEDQVCEALRRYRERECFIREALVHLYNLTTDTNKPQPDMLKLVVSGMQSHPTSLHVHLVATACVFNLTTQDLAEAMPVSLLSCTVTQLLYAMKTFPGHQQVQKNCLLALCSDYILQDVPFDKYLAATLVINWLSSHEDPTLQRMAVAVISILVAKLSTEETAQLSKDVFIMKQLLAIVQQKAMVGVVDSTLKFALSALWNLTDEMPAAARNFIQCQGLELYEEVLESYYNEPSIQQKVLGLLNNISEVEELQCDLMEEGLLEHIVSLLKDSQLEVGVRYFAGGILAQITSRPGVWILDEELRTTIIHQLHESIITWTQPEREMVSYRSFHPFGPLLQTHQPSGVQLWAVWAVHLVCSQNTSHYSSMLEKEGLIELLKALAAHPDTHGDVRGLSDSILHLVEQHQSLSGAFKNQTPNS